MKSERNKIVQVVNQLEEVLSKTGSISILNVEIEKQISPGICLDAVVEVQLPGKKKGRLWIEYISRGQPNPVRLAALQIKDLINQHGLKNDYPIVAAPGLSSKALQVCKDMQVNAIDLLGNCHLKMGPVLLDIYGRIPKKEERGLGRIFSPKRSRVIRLMLLNNIRPWLVEELENQTGVSIGLIPQIKKVLIEWEMGRKVQGGFILSDPGSLLERWSEDYDSKKIPSASFFSLGQPRQVEEEIIEAGNQQNIQAALGAFSGASRIAPAVRYNVVDAYVFGDESNLQKLSQVCGLKNVDSGPNVRLHFCEDLFLFSLTQEIGESRVMDDIQLFLDLKSCSGRGEEAAQALLEQRIKPRWQL